MVPDDGAAPDGALNAAMLGRLEQLGQTLDKVAARIETVAGRERRTRHLAWWMIVSFALDIILTVVVTILTISAISQSSAGHRAQLAACAISNQTRAEQITLWHYVVELSSQNPDSNKAQLARFEAFVRATFAPVDCARLYR